MKAVTTDLIDTLKGRHGNFIAVPGKFAPVEGLETRVSIKRFRSSVRYEVWQLNARKAFSILIQKYSELSSDILALQTWKDKAAELSITHGYTITARSLFFSYFIQKFYSVFSIYVMPSNLLSGISLEWDFRTSREWS